MVEYELRGGYPLRREEFDERMRCAEKYLFSLGVGDPAEEVGRINATVLRYLREEGFFERLGRKIGLR
ncbi:unnamed protein product [marine sediment metagenome]|uniref:Uncharacterized protein n=1 Tax=marine sediment metagenome TaxID=412755 RepID=X1E4W9_9ZZZZ